MPTKNNHSPFSNSFPNPLTSERIPIVPGIKDGRGRSLAIPLTHSISPIFVTLKSSLCETKSQLKREDKKKIVV